MRLSINFELLLTDSLIKYLAPLTCISLIRSIIFLIIISFDLENIYNVIEIKKEK